MAQNISSFSFSCRFNFQLKCAFLLCSWWCSIFLASLSIWRGRSFTVIFVWWFGFLSLCRRLGPVTLLSWLLTFLWLHWFLIFLRDIANLGLLHFLLRFLCQFLLTLLRFAHFGSLELFLGLFWVLHFRRHRLLKGQLHLCSFIHKIGQLVLKFGG